jgi:hypothetical protein
MQEGEYFMKRVHRSILTLSVSLLLTGVAVYGQVYRYYSPGTIWTVTTIRVKSGMDQAYLEYLDGSFKKETDALVQAGYMKSYKILKAIDEDTTSWNLVILREYASLADQEKNEEKSDAKLREVSGNDQQQMKGYEDRSRIREVLSTKTVRELRLK